jgi:O-antigen ligase
MIFSKNKISAVLLFCICFLTFTGFYFLIISGMNLFGISDSRILSITIRIFIVLFLILYFLINLSFFRRNTLIWNYLIFSFFYIFRLLYEYNVQETYYKSQLEVMYYFLSFSFIPFLFLSNIELSAYKLSYIFRSFLYSGLFFSLITLANYGQYIGQISRLEMDSGEENTINPLILAYNGIMVLGVSLFYWLYNKTSVLQKILLFSGIVLSIFPLLLGASRGSIVAIFVVLLLNVFSSGSAGAKLKYVALFVLFFFIIIFLNQYFGGGLADRFYKLQEDFDSGEDSALRLTIWKSSWSQFVDNPLFGDKFAVEGWKNYPHNIFLEVLQTTGIVGFVPFSILLFTVLVYAFRIMRYHKSYSWLSVVFILSFIQTMFSSNLFTAAWFWNSMAIVVGSYHYLSKIPMVTKYSE